MMAHIFLKGCNPGDEKLLCKVDLEVVPRGIYVIDDEPYQYTGQPTFIIKERMDMGDVYHALERVEIMVEKTNL